MSTISHATLCVVILDLLICKALGNLLSHGFSRLVLW